jgi:hypothetical protein
MAGVFDKFKINRSVNRVIEDKYFEQVAIEMSEGCINVGTWTRAKANAEGDKNKTEALYIKYRVQSLHDEVHIKSLSTKVVEDRTEKEVNNNSFIGIPAIEEATNLERYNGRGLVDVEELVEAIDDGAPLMYFEHSFDRLTSQRSLSIINSADACDEYPLHVAIKNKRLDIVVLLLEKGADKDLLNGWERTPLDMAIKLGVPEIIRALQ